MTASTPTSAPGAEEGDLWDAPAARADAHSSPLK